jgi:hypothetical protein
VRIHGFACAALAASLIVPASAGAQLQSIPPGEMIPVRTTEAITATTADGRVFSGTVDSAVRDDNGDVAIPAGSKVELIARSTTDNTIALDLDSVTVNGQRYAVRGTTEAATTGSNAGIGANQKTAEYIGGGALLGTIIGAIAGGGKGAAIGAAAGAAAGAGAQIVTSGRKINIPKGSLLTFSLSHALDVGVADNGFTRSGRHFHRNQSGF